MVRRSGRESPFDLELSGIVEYDAYSGVGGFVMGHGWDEEYRDLKNGLDNDEYQTSAETSLRRRSKENARERLSEFRRD